MSETACCFLISPKTAALSGRTLSERLLRKRALKAFSILVLLDSGIDLRDYSLVLWKVFNNVDPKRDILRQGGRMAIDATRKGVEDGHTRPWPADIEMDPEVAGSVRERAKELGIEEFLARLSRRSGSAFDGIDSAFARDENSTGQKTLSTLAKSFPSLGRPKEGRDLIYIEKCASKVV